MYCLQIPETSLKINPADALRVLAQNVSKGKNGMEYAC
jgi:hypothetical protein